MIWFCAVTGWRFWVLFCGVVLIGVVSWCSFGMFVFSGNFDFTLSTLADVCMSGVVEELQLFTTFRNTNSSFSSEKKNFRNMSWLSIDVQI